MLAPDRNFYAKNYIVTTTTFAQPCGSMTESGRRLGSLWKSGLRKLFRTLMGCVVVIFLAPIYTNLNRILYFPDQEWVSGLEFKPGVYTLVVLNYNMPTCRSARPRLDRSRATSHGQWARMCWPRLRFGRCQHLRAHQPQLVAVLPSDRGRTHSRDHV